MKTTAIIPVKRLATSHSRLDGVLSPEQRERLAEAMMLDVLGHVRRCRTVDNVLLVTADDRVARTARWMGVDVLTRPEDAGHAEAAMAGIRLAIGRGADRVVLLPIDCPLLDPAELDAHLGRTPRAALIVPDRHGSGTNALVLSPPDAFAPSFGPGSCARHVALARGAGISFALERIPSLELDVDTREDLELMRDRLILEPGAAPRTERIVCYLDPAGERDDSAAEPDTDAGPADGPAPALA